jgi:hypothetical protein
MMTLRLLAMALIVLTRQQGADSAVAPNGISSFEMDWPAAENPHWSIEVGEDRHGRYDRLADGAKPSVESKQALTVSEATQDRLRAGYKAVVGGACETKVKHLAQTGAKRIAYTAGASDAWSSCTFNYSDDKGLMDAVSAFQAIAETMQTGEKLQHSHRYDKLGLDAQLESLVNEAKEGRALEIQNIGPVLKSIAEDERVIDRARRKAARLLQDAVSAEPSPR